MAFLIAIAVIIFILTGYFEKQSRYYDAFIHALNFFGITLVAGIVLVMSVWLPLSYTSQYKIQTGTQTYALANLRDSTKFNLHGDFFLGIGSVNGSSSPSYEYYQHNTDGSYSLKQISANSTKVYQDGSTPRISCTYYDYTTDISFWIDPLPAGDSGNGFRTCVIHVPPHSIVNSYKLG